MDAVIVPSAKIQVILMGYGVDKPIYNIPSGIDMERYRSNKSPQRKQIREENIRVIQKENERMTEMLSQLLMLSRGYEGLSIVKWIVALHGGDISVESSLGAGTYKKAVEEYKEFFTKLMDTIPFDSSQGGCTEIWSITEEGWKVRCSLPGISRQKLLKTIPMRL